MKETAAFLSRLGIAAEEGALSASSKRFADDAQFRIEIPSCKSPVPLAAVLEEAEKCKLVIHRVSQGSGIMLMTEQEILEMARLACQARIELCLFVGPRAPFDVTPQPHTPAGKIVGSNLRYSPQLVYAIEDGKRACALGLRSVLVADLGLLWTLGNMKKAGELPANLILKISLLYSVNGPATAKIMERRGAGTINVSPGLTLAQLANLRQAIAAPLDIYVAVPDGSGDHVRYYETPEMIRVAAPVYVKLGLWNAADIYPSGCHLQQVAVAMSRERLRRARIVMDLIERHSPGAVESKAGSGADLAIPEDRTERRAEA